MNLVLDTNMITYIVMGFFGTLTIIFVLWKQHYASKARGKILLRINKATGPQDCILCKPGDKVIDVPAGPNRDAYTYIIVNNRVRRTEYPDGLPSFLQVSMNTLAYDEGVPDPLSPPKTPSEMTGELLRAIKNEKFTRVAVAASDEMQDLRKRIQGLLTQGLNKNFLYGGIALAIVVAGIAAYFAFMGYMNGVDLRAGWGY